MVHGLILVACNEYSLVKLSIARLIMICAVCMCHMRQMILIMVIIYMKRVINFIKMIETINLLHVPLNTYTGSPAMALFRVTIFVFTVSVQITNCCKSATFSILGHESREESKAFSPSPSQSCCSAPAAANCTAHPRLPGEIT